MNESLYNASEIEAMKAGTPVSKVISYGGNPKPESHGINVVAAGTGVRGNTWGNDAPTVTNFSQRKVVRPQVKHQDGSDNPQAAVYKPNLDRFNDADIARKKAKQEAELERSEHLQLTSPDALMKRLDTQNRLIKKLEKQIKSIQQTIKESSDDSKETP